MESRVAQANKMLKQFGKHKVKLIDFCTPEIMEISDDHLSLKIPLNDKTKNHLESMYFGGSGYWRRCCCWIAGNGYG